MQVIDLTKTYIQLEADTIARVVPVGADFWQKIESDLQLHKGWLITAFQFEAHWTNWEMHPQADEIVSLVSGAVNFVLELPEGEKVIELRGSGTVIVPRGVWHTVQVLEPSSMYFITHGAGTEIRPVE
jgi:mannose-6-phosphate isomerase-like protein (cupin superfamily)